MSTSVYCLDTSALIDGLERYYPAENFPGIWNEVDLLIDQGRVLISEEVYLEASKKDAVVKSWCDERKDSILVETDATIAAEVAEILKDHPKLVGVMKDRSRADPFVIAVARLRSAAVVTGESHGSANKPKIPFVCEDRGVDSMRFTDLIVKEKWSF